MDYDQWNPLISLSQIFTSLGYRTWKTPGSVSRKNTQRYESFQITFDTHFSSNRPTFPEENFVLTNEKDIVLINFISVRSFDTFTDTGTAVNVGTVAAITHQDVNKYAIKKKKNSQRENQKFSVSVYVPLDAAANVLTLLRVSVVAQFLQLLYLFLHDPDLVKTLFIWIYLNLIKQLQPKSARK